MGRYQHYLAPTYEQAQHDYYYSPESHALYRKHFSREFNQKTLDDSVNLLDMWRPTLPIDGRQWPFLKVVFLMANKRWPRGPVFYDFGRCNPALIAEGVRLPPIS